MLRYCLHEVFLLARSKTGTEKIRWGKLKFFTVYIREKEKYVFVCLASILFLAILSLPLPYLSIIIIDKYIPEKNFTAVSIIAFALLMIYLLRFIISFLSSYYFTILNQEIQVSLNNTLYRRLLYLPLTFFNSQQTGYILARAGEVKNLSMLFSAQVLGLFTDAFEFIFIIAVMLLLNVRLALISLSIIPLYYLVVRKFSFGLIKTSKSYLERSAVVSRSMQESLTGVNTIKTFNKEEYEAKKFSVNLNSCLKSAVVQNTLLSLLLEIVAFAGSLGMLIVLYLSAIEIMRGSFTVGGYIGFSAYMAKLYGPVQKFSNMGIILHPAMAALERISELFSYSTEEEQSGKLKLKGSIDTIEFDRVSFCYNEGNMVLRNVSFRMQKGDRIAVTGPNGSGKTTLISLLLQLYSSYEGVISFNGIDSRGINTQSIRERTGYVSQDIFLFNDSIINNIKYGNPEADGGDIMNASRLSGADEFISHLPDRYDTVVGERGVNLSAGQKQKLSIARALLRPFDILILDEATSSLDKASEENIKEGIVTKHPDKIVIFITHNPSHIALANKVLYLNNGKVLVEQPHRETIHS